MKDILSIKKRCLLLEGKQKDNLEEQISQFLRTEILPLWPEGWMYLNALKKVYNTMTENAKMLDNNNSKSNSPKQHSSITIMPVSNNKPPIKMDVSINHVTFGQISAGEVKVNPKVTEISPTSSHLSSFNINNILPLKTTQPPKPIPVQSTSSIKELEKPKYEKEHEYKKAPTPPESYKFGRGGDPPKTHQDSSVIIMNSRKDEVNSFHKENKELNAVISKAPHCQLIDLTEMPETKRKPKLEDIISYKFMKEPPGPSPMNPTSSNDSYTDMTKISSKHPELSVMPTYPQNTSLKPSSKSDGDDIQMVMENLKALQKLSSPIKVENPTSSPVSVIAYNRSFSPKSNNSSQSSPGHRGEFNPKTDFSGSFQDEFQKQFINSLQQLATTSGSSKSGYNRCS